VKIAEKAVAHVVSQGREQEGQPITSASVPDNVAALRSALEAAEAEVGRLRRRALDQDDRLELLEPIVTAIGEILARPEIEERDPDGNPVRFGLSSDEKLVSIGIARFMPHWNAKKEANGERPTITLGYLSKVIGMPKRRISKALNRLSGTARESGAPFQKVVTRRLVRDEHGQPIVNGRGREVWESSLEVRTWADSLAETLQTAATYAMPERPKHGGSKAASEAR
jgi:hypothetical protein